MLKKSVILQLILLGGTMILGTVLTSQASEGIKVLHAGAGLLSGLNAIVVAYLTYKEKATPIVQYLALAIIGLTFVAGVGGKVGETDYATGLLVMRVAAFAALVASILLLTKLKSKKA